MKVVLLAGGLGTRLSEQTDVRPKPMVEVGGHPILWHIMNLYAHHGYKDFVIALGYKGHVIKDYFLNHYARNSDFTIELSNGNITACNQQNSCDWKVTLVDTGEQTMTGGRLKRLAPYLENQSFMLTYGDGVANVDITQLVQFHKKHGKLATITAVHPKAHYGELEICEGQITNFMEKPEFKQSWINGGFMVLEPKFLEWIEEDSTILERIPMETAAQKKELMAYSHSGYWQCMDTLRDVKHLNELWNTDAAPWKVW